MPTRPSPFALAAALASFLACPAAASAVGTDYTSMESVWVDAVSPDGTTGHTIPALLNVPPAWMVGDAAVVVLRGEIEECSIRHGAGESVVFVIVPPSQERAVG